MVRDPPPRTTLQSHFQFAQSTALAPQHGRSNGSEQVGQGLARQKRRSDESRARTGEVDEEACLVPLGSGCFLVAYEVWQRGTMEARLEMVDAQGRTMSRQGLTKLNQNEGYITMGRKSKSSSNSFLAMDGAFSGRRMAYSYVMVNDAFCPHGGTFAGCDCLKVHSLLPIAVLGRDLWRALESMCQALEHGARQ